jgi:hypothetical protein
VLAFVKHGEKRGTYACFGGAESGWSAPTPFPGLTFCTDPHGVITAAGGDNLRRSFDKGVTWATYPTETTFCLFDLGHLARTGEVRFRTLEDGRFQVWTATFD